LAPPSAKPGVSSELNSRSVATSAKAKRVLSLNIERLSFVELRNAENSVTTGTYSVVLQNKAPEWRTGSYFIPRRFSNVNALLEFEVRILKYGLRSL
jgi:hypothetical protein